MKNKLNVIIKTGKDYEYDISACLKSLLKNSDLEIVCLSAQAIAELSKCEIKRLTYAEEDIIQTLLKILQKDITSENLEMVKQCCRALGNLCCDCDPGRTLILNSDGVITLLNLLREVLKNTTKNLEEIKLLVCKCILNFSIGGQDMSQAIVDNGIIDILESILEIELEKSNMNDEVVSTALLILSVINDNFPEFLFKPKINGIVLNILKETTNVEISELCLDHLHMQAEHGK